MFKVCLAKLIVLLTKASFFNRTESAAGTEELVDKVDKGGRALASRRAICESLCRVDRADKSLGHTDKSIEL